MYTGAMTIRVVGSRSSIGGWAAARTLQRTLAAMRGTGALVPRGVYRFATFDEADAWMTRQMARTHVSRKSRTSPASATR
jgi:hypothetical protein